jgi:hypothetical protein
MVRGTQKPCAIERLECQLSLNVYHVTFIFFSFFQSIFDMIYKYLRSYFYFVYRLYLYRSEINKKYSYMENDSMQMRVSNQQQNMFKTDLQ